MRNSVDFVIPGVHWPEETEEEPFSDILRAKHVGWFVEVLRRIDWIKVDREPCQEDWGVIVFVEHDKLRFDIGLSYGVNFHPPPAEDGWHAYVHHGTFAIKQRFTAEGKRARRQLVVDLDRALRAAGATEVRWYDEKDQYFKQPSLTPE